MDIGSLAELPERYWNVPYVGTRSPGSVPRGELHQGANCQLWAYEVLNYFDFEIPDLRSDELWDDAAATQRVDSPHAMDLVLYNTSTDPYGAHVGLWTRDAVAPLCQEVGRPIAWAESEFKVRARYAVRIGFKRPILRTG